MSKRRHQDKRLRKVLPPTEPKYIIIGVSLPKIELPFTHEPLWTERFRFVEYSSVVQACPVHDCISTDLATELSQNITICSP